MNGGALKAQRGSFTSFCFVQTNIFLNIKREESMGKDEKVNITSDFIYDHFQIVC